VQEDFNHHAYLYAADNHAYRTPTRGGVPFGSGLNALSHHSYDGDDFEYSVHTDAGSEPGNLAARAANLGQLTVFIQTRSPGNAVVVMGDTNTRYARTSDTIAEFAATNGLTDTWVQLVRGGSTPDEGSEALVCDANTVEYVTQAYLCRA
jgi:hypothetical protein